MATFVCAHGANRHDNFLVLLGAGVLLAVASWLDRRREAEMVARMEKLREHPEVAVAMIDGRIAKRKRETEILGQFRDHGGL